jgi:hypothetical protein
VKTLNRVFSTLMVVLSAVALSTCGLLTPGPLDGHSFHTANVLLVAGTKGLAGSVDGLGAAALFNAPGGIVSDGTSLYVTDQYNNNIRKIDIATGTVTTLAGSTYGISGNINGTGTAALFNGPAGICMVGGNLYVADNGNHTIRQVAISTGAVTTFAGSSAGGNVDNTGTAASFSSPIRICTDGTNLYVTDSGNYNVRQIVLASAAVTTVAGSGAQGLTDGTGTSAGFSQISGICVMGTTLCVSDYDTGRNRGVLRLIQLPAGIVTTQDYPVMSTNTYNNVTYSQVNSIGDSPVYDGSSYIYGVNGALTKVDTSSWYGIEAGAPGYSFSALCMVGTDIYLTDSPDHVVLKLQSISD